MDLSKRLLGYYDYTVVLTYCGMLFAVLGIFDVFQGNFLRAAICLMMAGVCDMFDGAVAATKERTPSEKCFGIQIDSMCDLISFGILPALFMYFIMEQSILAKGIAALYILCALIRLSYFNVLEEERQKQTTERRTSYLGVPVTTIAVLLPAVFALYDFRLIRSTLAFPILLTVCAAGFLSRIEIRKPHVIGKIVMIIMGLVEMAGLLFLMGADPL